jgi:hypothetical protein
LYRGLVEGANFLIFLWLFVEGRVLVHFGAEPFGVLFGMVVRNIKGLDGKEVSAAPAPTALL